MAPTAHELITKSVLDYYEGWYDADVGRMDRAVHNDLVKRSSAREHGAVLSFITKKQMLELTGQGEGRIWPISSTENGSKPRSAVARRPPQGLCGSLASFAEKMERGRSCIGTRIR